MNRFFSKMAESWTLFLCSSTLLVEYYATKKPYWNRWSTILILPLLDQKLGVECDECGIHLPIFMVSFSVYNLETVAVVIYLFEKNIFWMFLSIFETKGCPEHCSSLTDLFVLLNHSDQFKIIFRITTKFCHMLILPFLELLLYLFAIED